MIDASLPPGARLHYPSEFTAALRGKPLARGAFFIVSGKVVVSLAGTAQPSARLGLVIAKRFAASAVTRNAIKRVVREAFRHVRLILPAANYVVRLNAPIPLISLTALKKKVRTEVDDLFVWIARQ